MLVRPYLGVHVRAHPCHHTLCRIHASVHSSTRMSDSVCAHTCRCVMYDMYGKVASSSLEVDWSAVPVGTGSPDLMSDVDSLDAEPTSVINSL